MPCSGCFHTADPDVIFEELERQRADFLRMVSQELRASLASIKGSAGTVLEGLACRVPGRDARVLPPHRRAGEPHAGPVADLLDADSIEAGTLTVAPELTCVGARVDWARSTFLSGGKPTPRSRRPSDRPGTRDARPRAARHARGDSVSDEGLGMPPRELPRLFCKRVGVRGGAGRGLAISKGLAEAHGAGGPERL